jgi:pimeloyl-ACP methyl ester carboxylesterase
MSSCLCKLVEGAGFPFQVESLEDGVDDSVYTFYIHKAHHGTGASSYFHEAAFDDVGGAQLLPEMAWKSEDQTVVPADRVVIVEPWAHIPGHSTGGGEVVHYLARHGESRVAKAAIISAVPPLMLKTAANPTGQPKEVFDGLQAQLAANRAQFYYDVPAGPFYGYNRPGAKPSQGIIWNWWRQGMMGGTKAHYDGIVAFSQTDFTEDLKKITVPVLVMHSEDDQIVPYVAAGPLSAKLLRNSTLKTYKDFPHGMPTTEADTINADLLAFLKKSKQAAA